MAGEIENTRMAPDLAKASELLKSLGFTQIDKVVTSKDIELASAQSSLETTPADSNFQEWQLPMIVQSTAELFLRVARAETELVERFCYADTILLIAAGSVKFEVQDLHAGDWIYIPRTSSYKVKTGIDGATIVRISCLRANCYYRPQT